MEIEDLAILVRRRGLSGVLEWLEDIAEERAKEDERWKQAKDDLAHVIRSYNWPS